MPVKFAVTAEQMRRLDERAVREFGIPILTLMENAGKAVARQCLALIRRRKIKKPRVLVLCGGGNNGGDGFVAARLLHQKMIPVKVVLLKPKDSFKGAVLANFKRMTRLGISCEELPPHAALKRDISDCNLAVDALVGTGLKSRITGPLRLAIATLNAGKKTVLAVDIPSGLDADTGQVHGICARAYETVTMAALKAGFLKGRSRKWTGKVTVADIGIPL